MSKNTFLIRNALIFYEVEPAIENTDILMNTDGFTTIDLSAIIRACMKSLIGLFSVYACMGNIKIIVHYCICVPDGW